MVKLDELKYWKIKSSLMELNMEEMQLRQRIGEIQTRRTTILTELELEPQGQYKLNDNEFTIERVNSDG